MSTQQVYRMGDAYWNMLIKQGRMAINTSRAEILRLAKEISEKYRYENDLSLKRWCEQIGLAYNSLVDWRSTEKRIKLPAKIASQLSQSHLRILARLKPNEQAAYAREALLNNLGPKALHARIYYRTKGKFRQQEYQSKFWKLPKGAVTLSTYVSQETMAKIDALRGRLTRSAIVALMIDDELKRHVTLAKLVNGLKIDMAEEGKTKMHRESKIWK